MVLDVEGSNPSSRPKIHHIESVVYWHFDSVYRAVYQTRRYNVAERCLHGTLPPTHQKLPHKLKGIGYSRCTCPVWVDGPHPITGERLRRSLETRDWARGQRLLEKWESQLKETGTVSLAPTVAEAAEMYLKDCRAPRWALDALQSWRFAPKPSKRCNRFLRKVGLGETIEVGMVPVRL